ncbi:MAG: hypothetical protein HYV26_07830 [Candidatus Hydrogenedentes bacterium]|nr:hypothetical protein [Candidatus Hydrogenedentota bacterium]
MAAVKAKKKAAKSPIERLSEQAEELGDRISKRAEETADQTRKRAAKLALSVIDFEKTTFDNAFKMIDKLQKQTEELLKDYIGNASWMPKEGKAVVDEWTRMLQGSRREFLKTVDKSFEHLSEYVKRVQDGKQVVASKKVVARKVAKAKPRKRVMPKAAAAAAM